MLQIYKNCFKWFNNFRSVIKAKWWINIVCFHANLLNYNRNHKLKTPRLFDTDVDKSQLCYTGTWLSGYELLSWHALVSEKKINVIVRVLFIPLMLVFVEASMRSLLNRIYAYRPCGWRLIPVVFNIKNYI